MELVNCIRISINFNEILEYMFFPANKQPIKKTSGPEIEENMIICKSGCLPRPSHTPHHPLLHDIRLNKVASQAFPAFLRDPYDSI